MKRWTVRKTLELEVIVEAETEQEAVDKMLDMDDNQFVVIECDYEAWPTPAYR